MKDLAPGNFTARGVSLAGAVGRAALDVRPGALGYEERPTPHHVVLVLDNGAAAAAADPSLSRLAASRTLVDDVLCRDAGRTCAHGAADVTLLVLQGARLETLASESRDAAAIGVALETLARGATGETALWPGLLEAATRARALAGRGGSTAIIAYVAQAAEGGAVPAQVSSLLTASPRVPLLVALGAGEEGVLRSVAEGSGGALRTGAGAAQPADQLSALRCALVGHWTLSLSLGGAAPARGEYVLEGELEVRLGDEVRAGRLELPLVWLP